MKKIKKTRYSADIQFIEGPMKYVRRQTLKELYGVCAFYQRFSDFWFVTHITQETWVGDTIVEFKNLDVPNDFETKLELKRFALDERVTLRREQIQNLKTTINALSGARLEGTMGKIISIRGEHRLTDEGDFVPGFVYSVEWVDANPGVIEHLPTTFSQNDLAKWSF